MTHLSEKELGQLGLSIIQTIPDAVIYADRKGVIRFWNAGATRIFEFSEEEAIGESLDIIIPERLRKRHWNGYHHMMETGQARHGPDELLAVPATAKSGRALSIQFTVTPIYDGDGKLTGIAAILRDVTATFQELRRLRAGG
jgi:PAS domain S-box-containing protein